MLFCYKCVSKVAVSFLSLLVTKQAFYKSGSKKYIYINDC